MDTVAQGRRSAARLFAAYALISLIPIAALGFILAGHFRQEARQRGLSQGRAEAKLVAQAAVGPLLDGASLSHGLSAGEGAGMLGLVRQWVDSSGQGALRLRLRNLQGHVVFSDDGTGFGEPVDDQALDAASGQTVAVLTHLNADTEDASHPAASSSTTSSGCWRRAAWTRDGW